MNEGINPKADFQKDKARSSAFADVMAAPSFRDGAKTALLAYACDLDLTNQPAANGLKLAGAREFLNTLLMLGEKYVPKATASDEALEAPETLLIRKPAVKKD